MLKTILAAICLCACGSTAKKQDTQEPSGPHVPQIADTNTQSDAGTTAPPSAATLTDQDCEALFAHVFEVAFQSQRNELPEAEQPTEEDLRAAKDALRKEIFGQCVGAERNAFQYDCAMAAADQASMQKCMGG